MREQRTRDGRRHEYWFVSWYCPQCREHTSISHERDTNRIREKEAAWLKDHDGHPVRIEDD